MRALIVGDVHLQRKLIKRSRELLSRISSVIETRQPDTVILLGDVFDTHDRHDNDCITAYSEFIMKNEGRVKIYHVLGNHECNDSRTFLPNVHVLNAWHGRKNVTICDKPMALAQEDGTILGFVPYVPNGRFAEAVSMLEDPPHLVFAHQEFKDCLMASHRSETGDSIPEFEVISGHIHGSQKIGNVWYPGTPCQQNFSEEEDKFVYIIDIQNGTYRIEEQIDLEMPKFVTIRTNAQEYPEMDLASENLFRIVVKDTPENIVLYKRSSFYKKLYRNVKFKFEIVRPEAARTENERNLDFDRRFRELIQQEGLESAYEAIFKAL